jgi:single-strand DNA-binding protein
MKNANANTQSNVKLNVIATNTNASANTQEPALIKKEVVNKVAIIGHMGTDPEIKEFTNALKKAKFRVATNRYFKNKQNEWQSETTWHNVIAWGPLAEQAQSKLAKGMAVNIEGKLNYRMYTDEKGVDRFYTEIVATSLVAIPAKAKETETATETLKIAA